ncbi:MAG: serine/threonine-protein kinase [Planctomycetota bacterium]
MQLTCPAKSRLREFLEGSIDGQEEHQISAHVVECSHCDQVLGELESEQNDVLKLIREDVQTDRLLQEPAFEELRNTVGLGRADTTLALNEDEPFETGKRLRDYRLVKKIGEGGMGTVYQAVHLHLAKPVALKILPTDKLQSRQSVSRFRQEMRAVGRVNHPNVVSASDAGKIDGQHFLVMELVQGADLARIIKDQGPLSVSDACEIVRQAATGLQHAHDSGLVHRDVKPSNVMLSADGRVKVLDLGLASLNKTEFEASTNIVVKEGLTSVGQIMGTLDFMAPEQITASPEVDGRADVYALGATLFQLLTGRTPCGDRSEGTPQRIEAVLKKPPRDIATLRNDVPEELRELLFKMLAKDPADRPQTASDVADEIAQFTSEANIVALAEACQTSIDMPSADVDVTEDASLLVSRTIGRDKQITEHKPRTAIGVWGLFLAFVAASTIYFVTNKGIVRVEIKDDMFQATIDGQVVTVKDNGHSKPVKLQVGDHELVVRVGDTDLITNKFEISRSEETILRVELLQGEVIVSRDGNRVGSRLMPETPAIANANETDQPSEKKRQTTLADLPGSDAALIYQLLTGIELGGQASHKPNPSFANIVNVLLDRDSISREEVAKKLVELGKPEVARVLLADGRVAAPAAEALKLGDLLVASGDGEKAVDAYLEALRIAPHLFQSKFISTFDEQGRLKDLAQLFTEDRLRQTRAISQQNSLLERLMKDDVRASIGMPYMGRVWNARPDLRAWIINDVPWSEVPNRAEYFSQLLIPSNLEEIGNGYSELFASPDIHGGWLYDLRNILDEETARQLIAEVEPKVQAHENWVAGSVIMVSLEAIAGDYEPAKQWIKENYKSVRPYQQKSDQDEFLAVYAGFLGDVLNGRDRELDLWVIKLYKQSLEHRDLGSPYRNSRLHELAKLYHKYGRTSEGIDLLYGLVERESEAKEYLVDNWGRVESVNLEHERIWDLRTAVKTLNSIGRPLDSLELLSRITFEQRRAAQQYKGGGYTYDDKDVDRYTKDSRKLVTSNAIVEALNRGVVPIGLTSTLDRKSGKINNPIIELLEEVARGEVSDESKTAFERVNLSLTDDEAMDQFLADLIQREPADTDVVVAATIFAFLRNDVDAAKQRLTHLASVLDDKSSYREADVNLYLAAELAVKKKETAGLGRSLAAHAIQAGQRMNDEWKEFFIHVAKKPEFSTNDGEGQSEFRIEVRIIESAAIDGVTKQDPNSLYHLRIKPALVITSAEVASVQKRVLRGPTIENRKTGESKHYPRLVVDIQLTDEAKLRLKTAVEKTSSRKITTVLNDKHLGGWGKYITDENQEHSPLAHWRQFGPRISITGDPKKADELIEYLTPPRKVEHSDGD